MRLYHITTNESAKLIVKNGFKNGFGNYACYDKTTGRQRQLKGVFFADKIIRYREKVENGNIVDTECVFIVKIPVEVISGFELKEEIKSYREWCIPVKIVNRYFTDKKIYSCYDESLYKKPKVKIPLNKLGSLTRDELLTAVHSK